GQGTDRDECRQRQVLRPERGPGERHADRDREHDWRHECSEPQLKAPARLTPRDPRERRDDTDERSADEHWQHQTRTPPFEPELRGRRRRKRCLMSWQCAGSRCDERLETISAAPTPPPPPAEGVAPFE